MKFFYTSLLYCFVIIIPGIAQTPEQVLASNKRGLEILRESFKQYGALKSTDSLQLAFTISNDHQVDEGQSFLTHNPFDHYKSTRRFIIDRAADNESGNSKAEISGDFTFESSWVIEAGRGKTYDHSMQQYEEHTGAYTTNTIFLPQNFIGPVLRNPAAVRFLDEVSVEGKKFFVIRALRNIDLVDLTISADDFLLYKVEQIVFMGIYGDADRVITYDQYVSSGILKVPQRLTIATTNFVNGTVSNTYAVTNIRTGSDITKDPISIPDAAIKQDYSFRKKFNLRELSKGIYVIENVTETPGQWSYNVLFAEFDDHILVAEAPIADDLTQRIINKIQETIPGKPIRYVVQSHHHSDHLGGIRGYIANGTTIITTADQQPVIDRIAKAPYNLYPDRQAKNPKDATFKLVTNGKLILKDKTQEAIIYDIGPNPHAKGMLIIYFPKQKILYQADMVNRTEYPHNKSTDDFIVKMKKLKLVVDTMIGLHGITLNREDVAKLLK
jgi:glyoxylase-like metal-dependent hydrolase (beta-lactamase superfamily II)